MELIRLSADDLLKALDAHNHAKNKVGTSGARALFKRDLMILATETKTGMPVSDKELVTINASIPKIGKAISMYDTAFKEYQESHK